MSIAYAENWILCIVVVVVSCHRLGFVPIFPFSCFVSFVSFLSLPPQLFVSLYPLADIGTRNHWLVQNSFRTPSTPNIDNDDKHFGRIFSSESTGSIHTEKKNHKPRLLYYRRTTKNALSAFSFRRTTFSASESLESAVFLKTRPRIIKQPSK